MTPTQKLEAVIPKLEEDVDLLAEEWEDGILITVCELAICCIQPNCMNRPKTNVLVEKLGQLVSRTRPKQAYSGNTGTMNVNESKALCLVCGKDSTFVSMCKDHFICQQCFEDHVYTHLGDETICCQINGCDKTFSKEDLSYLNKLHVKKRDENDKWSKLWQDQK